MWLVGVSRLRGLFSWLGLSGLGLCGCLTVFRGVVRGIMSLLCGRGGGSRWVLRSRRMG